MRTGGLAIAKGDCAGTRYTLPCTSGERQRSYRWDPNAAATQQARAHTPRCSHCGARCGLHCHACSGNACKPKMKTYGAVHAGDFGPGSTLATSPKSSGWCCAVAQLDAGSADSCICRHSMHGKGHTLPVVRTEGTPEGSDWCCPAVQPIAGSSHSCAGCAQPGWQHPLQAPGEPWARTPRCGWSGCC